jgi:hypothetical protein
MRGVLRRNVTATGSAVATRCASVHNILVASARYQASVATAAAPPSTTVSNGNLQGLSVAAFVGNSKSAATDLPVAIGRITAQISSEVYAVSFNELSLSPVVEVGCRVYIVQGQIAATNSDDHRGGGGGDAGATNTSGNNAAGVLPSIASAPPVAAAPQKGSSQAFAEYEVPTTIAGLVAKVNGNGTYGVLLDDDKFEPTVPRDHILLSEGRSKLLTNEKYENVLAWVKSAGVDKRSDQESTACILFSRGWRAEKLYLLDQQDVHCLSHLNKSVRMTLLEKADWEREHQRQRRDMSKERLKEKDFRYVLTKYSSVFSACVAVFTAISVFTWNFKNWRKGLRSTQMEIAVEQMAQDIRKPKTDRNEVSRSSELERLRQMMRRLDVQHPRVVVVTGSNGAGKSHLCRVAAYKEKLAAVFVDIRGNEDPLKAVVKSLGVQNVDVCGDLHDFISEACDMAKKKMNGATPLIVMKLREGNLQRVYNEAIALACDRRLCHVLIECPIECVTISVSSLPRLDFYTVPTFTAAEAFQYTQHLIDPLELLYFVDIVGTNSNDLDELIAAVVQRDLGGAEYTNRKLIKAMRQLQGIWTKDARLRAAVTKLSEHEYDVGLREVHDLTLKHDALKDIVFYNSVTDSWMFQNKLYHSAARSWL